MNELVLEGVSHGPLLDVSARFVGGRQVVLGSEQDGTRALIAVIAGLAQPRAGRVSLNGLAPWSSPSARRSIASLAADEALLPAPTVAGAIVLALRARGDARSARQILESAGLATLLSQRACDVTPRETRALILAVALSHPAPRLVALHEPLALLGLVAEGFVLESLSRCAANGAIVLSSASRLEDAARLGHASGSLERGRWLDASQSLASIAQFTVRVLTPEPRRLAARLAEAPDISSIEWSGGQELRVRGRDLHKLSHSIVANARAEAIRISALKQEPPSLEALAAARAGLAQAAYEQAHSGPASELG